MAFEVFDLGLVSFEEALQFQKGVFAHVKNGSFTCAIVLCRHHPVITLGRRALKENIIVSEQELRGYGIKIHSIERGGDVTYHGPGQFIAYPVFDLSYFKKDVHLFLRQLEQAVINLLSGLGIEGLRYKGLTGVWVNKKKIASIGVAIRNWITFHGLSINVKKYDLHNFRLIKPCGMDIEMTSLESVSGRNMDFSQLKEGLIRGFEDAFDLTASCLL